MAVRNVTAVQCEWLDMKAAERLIANWQVGSGKCEAIHSPRVSLPHFVMSVDPVSLIPDTKSSSLGPPDSYALPHTPPLYCPTSLLPLPLSPFQVAKQACLGPHYDASALSVVLTGQALSEAQQRSSEFRTKGCHMEYKLSKCELGMAPGSGTTGGPVVLTATFDESASLCSGSETVDQYRGSYRAQYHVVKTKAGAGGGEAVWRISKIVVEGEDGRVFPGGRH